MHIYIGNELRELCDNAVSLEKRDLYEDIDLFLSSHPQGKVLALFGLRRTGKTVMMLQMAAVDPEKSAYVLVSDNDDMSDIDTALWELKDQGYRRFFLDEITKARHFTNFVDGLADNFAMSGCHIVMAGTDSLNFKLAEIKALGRIIRFNTTRIPFAEQSRLDPGLSFKDYIKYGGLLDSTSFFDKVVEKGYTYGEIMGKEYTLSAIAENIQHSLESFQGVWPGKLHDLCRMQEMTSLINLCAHYDSHKLLLKTVNQNYSSEGVSHFVGAFNSLANPEKVDKRLIAKLYRRRLSILDLDERQVRLTQDLLDETESLLYDIDALRPVTRLVIDKNDKIYRHDENVFSQSGVRWGQIENLVEVAKTLKPDISPKILSQIGKVTFGKIFEEALFLESLEAAEKNNCQAVRISYVNGAKSAEVDIIFALPEKVGFYAFEAKASETGDKDDFRHLRNRDFIAKIENLYGPMLDYAVVRPAIQEDRPHEIDAENLVLNILPKLHMMVQTQVVTDNYFQTPRY